MKKIFTAIALITSTFLCNAQNAGETIKIDINSEDETYESYWSKCVGAGRANEALRAGWLEQMQLVQENCGFEYVRFHGLFHEDMFPVFGNSAPHPLCLTVAHFCSR